MAQLSSNIVIIFRKVTDKLQIKNQLSYFQKSCDDIYNKSRSGKQETWGYKYEKKKKKQFSQMPPPKSHLSTKNTFKYIFKI